ncbi:helix-turn-helix domain-containing protein [Streptomyces sp. NPDC014748]|uniref:helix-turn-helix domain-containing protein n=1 Tax=Streptomyces sp. NPDC014748 TaxID=3364905 RepID=UPI00370068DA
MTEEDQGHSPPGYGALIRLAREAQGISPETAAARMPYQFSGSSWRQIEAGFRGRGAKRKPVPGKASTVAAMARTVGLTADRLQEHHPEAAAILREMERQEAQQASHAPEAPQATPPHVRRMIEAALEDVDPRDRPELLRELAADYDAVVQRRARNTGRHQRPRHAG